MNLDEILIRSHRTGTIMTGVAKNWTVEQSTTCANYLGELMRALRWNRKVEFSNKYIEKGLKSEEDGITLFSRAKGYFFKKNTERINNSFLSGEPDLYEGESIKKAKQGWDIKCSWDWNTFPYPNQKLDSNYKYQALAYMALTGAEKWTIVYALVNAPANLVDSEKRNLFYKMGCPNETNEAYIIKRKAIEKNLIFDMAQFIKDNPAYDIETKDFHEGAWIYDVPREERIVEFEVLRDTKEIEKIYKRVIECREYLKELHASFMANNPVLKPLTVEG